MTVLFTKMSFHPGNRDFAIPRPIMKANGLFLGLKNKPAWYSSDGGTMLELLICAHIILWTFSVFLTKTNSCIPSSGQSPVIREVRVSLERFIF